MELSPATRTKLLDLARQSLAAQVRGVAFEPPPPDDPELTQPAGCFVSLHERPSHRLRGCVGRLDATQPLWQAVHQTSRDVLGDPRFTTLPVTERDLPNIDIEISVISPLTLADSPINFDPQKHGIYLHFADRAGCFLPQVARETGWSKEQLLDRLCMEKLRVPPEAWRHPSARLFTFTTEIVGPEPV